MTSEIANSFACPGIITGIGGRPYLVSNCYYKDYETSLPITSNNSIITNNSSFSSSGTNWTLNTPPYVNGASYTDLVDALNAWVDANNSEGIYRHWAADSANVNGGFPVFAAIPCTTVTNSDSIVVCDSYTWRGTTYTSSTELMDTLSTMDGCDSIVTHYLIVNHGSNRTDTVSAMESYSWADSTYTASGIYQHSWSAANDCDSTVTLWLTITRTVHDTTFVDVHDTTYVNIHDTTYVQVHDTTYIDVPYPVHDTTYIDIYDTTYVYVHDTAYIDVPYPVHDTTTVTEYIHDTVTNTVHDTTLVTVTDMLVLTEYDTIYITLYDTVYIYDTVYVGVDNVRAVNVKLFQQDGAIVVEGAEGHPVWLYDVVGRMVNGRKREDNGKIIFDVPASGVYLVKVGDAPARRIVVIR